MGKADVNPFGPLFASERMRLARRGTTVRLRVAYGLALLLALFLLYLAWFGVYGTIDGRALDRNETAKFSESFVSLFMAVQFWSLVLVTPTFVAGAVAEEKERGSLVLLLTTSLRGREI